jgi:hypothetical protein
VTPELTNIPGRRNLKVALREGRTGNLTFGAGFSSLESAVVFAEVSQSNFDLFNYRSFFQGDGQKFRLRFQIGSQSSEAVLYFVEPWLFERELGLGFQLYHQTSDYNSAFYEELRAGGEVFLRKRLFELFEGRLSYRYEVVDIRNVDPLAPEVIRSLAGVDFRVVGFILVRLADEVQVWLAGHALAQNIVGEHVAGFVLKRHPLPHAIQGFGIQFDGGTGFRWSDHAEPLVGIGPPADEGLPGDADERGGGVFQSVLGIRGIAMMRGNPPQSTLKLHFKALGLFGGFVVAGDFQRARF